MDSLKERKQMIFGADYTLITYHVCYVGDLTHPTPHTPIWGISSESIFDQPKWHWKNKRVQIAINQMVKRSTSYATFIIVHLICYCPASFCTRDATNINDWGYG